MQMEKVVFYEKAAKNIVFSYSNTIIYELGKAMACHYLSSYGLAKQIRPNKYYYSTFVCP